MKFLVVDDSKSIHNVLYDTLSELNPTFLHAYNGREAVEVVKDSSFDAELILLDWEMPQLSCIEALSLLKQERPEQIILMMTSKNSLNNIIEALDKGANDYIMKPFTNDILLGKINTVLGKDLA
ncbi:MAG: response regulator [Spirobacillus cienkowskii]|jgi:DNA-binding response OmpR family regulator|uniref:Response regulator n=1 Tax=Spirobacillus cienkowskii TaxID=495820 RepID=A0A369KXY3_9BACT|nr:MAG: response regulator [Spirobacillus cienkowskii]